jgi:thimet oligopeptidase
MMIPKYVVLILLSIIIFNVTSPSFATQVSEQTAQLSAEAVAFKAQCEKDLNAAKSAFKALEKYQGPVTIESVLVPYNNIWITMDKSYNLSSVYQAVHPDPGVREVAAVCEQDFSKLITEINLSRPLYDLINKLDVTQSDPKTKRFVEITLRDFRRAGVDKDSLTREKIKILNEDLVKIGQEFGKIIREDVRYILLDSKDDLEGLPQDYIDNHQVDENGKIKITTDYPDYIPFMTYAKSDKYRFELYKEFRRRGYPQNENILEQLLQKRYELANLLGYKNFAQYITEDKMIKNPKAAQDFIDKVTKVASSRADNDYQELLAGLRKEIPSAQSVGDWQKTYISEMVKKEKYDFDSQELRQYFSYDKVKEGLFVLTSKMYAIQFKKVDVPVWDKSVEAYEIWDGDALVGRFYLDMHPRQDKFKHAMMSQVVTGISGVQIPEAVLVCNFPGGDETAGLMEHDQVSTFFHEFGHLLHHIFAGNQPWFSLSGISTEWDFVEAPSTLFEEWVWNGDVLKTFAVNNAGETIPDDLIRKMNRSRMFSMGLNVEQQMFYAAVSLNFYDRDASSFKPLSLMQKLQKKYTPFAYVDSTYMYLSFDHLVDYSAIYYTYMWSEVIAKDLFSVFQKKGLENPEVAVKYRKTILEPGGSKDAAELVKDFLGREYSFQAFQDWLNANTI